MAGPLDALLDNSTLTMEQMLAILNGEDGGLNDSSGTPPAWLQEAMMHGSDWTALGESGWQSVIIVAYSVVIVFGFLANLLVIVTIARFKQLHTVTNVFIAYLALADVALCVFNLPMQLHYQLSHSWAFGRVLCHVAMPTFGVPFFSSSSAILMIAVDRYMLIVFPFKPRMSTTHALFVVLLILLLTVALSTPLILSIEYVEIPHPFLDTVTTSCAETYWPSYTHKRVYSVSIFLLQFIMPICLTSFFYARICTVLTRRPITAKKKQNDTRRNLRTNRILIAVVLTFTLCWLPWSVFALTSEFNNRFIPVRYFSLVDMLLKLFAMGSACINPFLYGWLNDSFKKELGKLVGYRMLLYCCGSQCCKPSDAAGSRWRHRGGGRHAGVSYSRTTDVNNATIVFHSEAVRPSLDLIVDGVNDLERGEPQGQAQIQAGWQAMKVEAEQQNNTINEKLEMSL